MGRYVKQFRRRVGMALGPSEERNFTMWVGYELRGVEKDLSDHGLFRVDSLSDEEVAERYAVHQFRTVNEDETEIYRFLGLDDPPDHHGKESP